MGGSLQRLEVLLVGLVLVCAGAVVAMLLVLRPPAPAASIQTTPQPIAVGAAQPTQVPIATPAARSAPLVSAPPQIADAPLTEPLASPHVTVPVAVMAAWPWLLLVVGLGGSGAGRSRDAAAGGSATPTRACEQLFAASDRVTHASNMQIVRDLAERGLLTPELAAATGVDHDQSKPGWMGQLLNPRLPQPDVAALHLAEGEAALGHHIYAAPAASRTACKHWRCTQVRPLPWLIHASNRYCCCPSAAHEASPGCIELTLRTTWASQRPRIYQWISRA